MRSRRRFTAISHTAPLLLAIALGACEASPVTQRQFVQEPKRNELIWVAEDHLARFGPGISSLSPAEQQRLGTFLRQISASPQDSFVIDPGGTDVAALERAASVSEVLRQALPTVGTAIRSSSDAPGTDQVRVTVGRYVVITPECGDWSKPSGTDIFNRPSSNFGCATTANLGLMVANPSDLVRGRQMTPAMADRAVSGLTEHRLGKNKKFTDDPILNVQPDY